VVSLPFSETTVDNSRHALRNLAQLDTGQYKEEKSSTPTVWNVVGAERANEQAQTAQCIM
jgi:hypothetical protein